MSETIHYEIQLLAASLVIGVGLMVAYDGLRLFRLLIRHGNVWTGMEDAIYWLCSGMVTFLLLFKQNDGILRGYAILGVLAGMLAYHSLISRSLFRLLKKLKKYYTMNKKQRALKKK